MSAFAGGLLKSGQAAFGQNRPSRFTAAKDRFGSKTAITRRVPSVRFYPLRLRRSAGPHEGQSHRSAQHLRILITPPVNMPIYQKNINIFSPTATERLASLTTLSILL